MGPVPCIYSLGALASQIIQVGILRPGRKLVIVTVAAETLRRALTELLGPRRIGRCARQLGRPRPIWAIGCAHRPAGKARRAKY
jgi:hypothetical protein